MRVALAVSFATLVSTGAFAAANNSQPWDTFNGDLMAQKYSKADQITPANVHNLRMAWQVHTGDVSLGGKIPETYFEATPLFANDTVYVGTPFYRIFAIAPDTGKVKWVFDPHAKLKALTQPGMKSRGVAYWQSADPIPGKPCQKIVYVGTMTGKLFAVDANDGRPCAAFGKNGILDVNQWNNKPGKWPLSLLQPPTVYKDTLLISWSGKDWADAVAPAGKVFAVDARTGALKWTFDPFPPGAQDNSGTADVWASMSVDRAHGIVYLPVSSPSPNYYGGARKESLPLATSVTAVDANTGRVIWSRQLVHHDIWDYDTNSAPVLVDIHKDGQTIPALIQSTKMGLFFAFNRLNGDPIWPIVEERVPQSDVPGEQASPTQPFQMGLKRAVPARWSGVSAIGDIASGGYCSREFHKLRYEGLYTPPSLQGTLAYPPTVGGVEWGGGAVDPVHNTYIVNNSYSAQIYKLIPRAKYDKITKGKPKKNYFAQKGSPYGVEVANFTNWLGMPCWAPPYGSMSAYDLNTGKLLWKKPFGEVQKWGFYMPMDWGSVTIGAPIVTKSGLIFIGASMDSRVRAIDEKTGKVLWQQRVDAPAVAMPATYVFHGKQYVVFCAGGNKLLVPRVSDQIVAFSLP